jgi:hypothetical protein
MANTKTTAAPAPAWASEWARLIFQLYLAVVCSISLLVGVFSAGSMLTGGVDLAIPRPVYVAETRWDDATKTEQPRAAADIERERVRIATEQTETTQRDLMHSGIYLLLAFGVFGYHWRLFKARKE